MKIACCIFRYFPYGGLQRDFFRIATRLIECGHEVHVFARSWEGSSLPGAHLQLISTRAHTNHGRERQFIKKVLPLLRGFDQVLGFNRMPGLTFYFAGDVCYAAEMAKRSFWHRLTYRYRAYIALERAVYAASGSTKILLLAPTQKQVIQQYYHTPDERFILLPPGIDRDRIPTDSHLRASMRTQWQLADDDILLLMVGSDPHRKGVDRALAAFASLPSALRQKTYLYIIGKGDAPATTEPHIKFLGPRDDAPNFMVAADVLLHPARVETAGMVLIEALVAQLPIIVSGVCGYAAYVQAAAAGVVLTEPFSQAAFNVALLSMLTSDRAIFKNNAAQYIKTHDVFGLVQSIERTIFT